MSYRIERREYARGLETTSWHAPEDVPHIAAAFDGDPSILVIKTEHSHTRNGTSRCTFVRMEERTTWVPAGPVSD